MSASPSPAAPTLHGLDALRFTAAAMVVAFHFDWRSPESAGWARWGWVGVEIFFVISGLVIALSAERATRTAFLRQRALRLYPGAWVCGAFSAAVLWLFSRHAPLDVLIQSSLDPARLIGSLVLFSPVHLSTAYWTLPTELAFYALVTVFIGVQGPDRMRWVARCLVGTNLVYYTALVGRHLHWLPSSLPLDFGTGLWNATLLRDGSTFAIGIYLFCLLDRERWSFEWRRLPRLDQGLLLLALGLTLLHIAQRASYVILALKGPGLETLTPVMLAAQAAIVFGASLAFLVVTVVMQRRGSPPSGVRRLLRFMGLVTYPVYLLHESVGGTVLAWMAALGAGPYGGRLTAAAAAVLVASALCLQGEQALRRWLERALPKPQR